MHHRLASRGARGQATQSRHCVQETRASFACLPPCALSLHSARIESSHPDLMSRPAATTGRTITRRAEPEPEAAARIRKPPGPRARRRSTHSARPASGPCRTPASGPCRWKGSIRGVRVVRMPLRAFHALQESRQCARDIPIARPAAALIRAGSTARPDSRRRPTTGRPAGGAGAGSGEAGGLAHAARVLGRAAVEPVRGRACGRAPGGAARAGREEGAHAPARTGARAHAPTLAHALTHAAGRPPPPPPTGVGLGEVGRSGKSTVSHPRSRRRPGPPAPATQAFARTAAGLAGSGPSPRQAPGRLCSAGARPRDTGARRVQE